MRIDENEAPTTEVPVAEEPPPEKKKQGFATLSRERRSEISRMGAQAAAASGRAHRFTSDEARAAGSKGGKAPHRVRGRGARRAREGASQ